ncbi:MAG: serine hydrolase domain-containing protein [Pseudomonadota bacterium]
MTSHTFWTPAQFRAAKLKAESLIAGLTRKGEPGGMVAVITQGQLAWQRHWGLAHMIGHVPNLPGTRHSIGAAAHMLTAACAWKMAQTGRLDLKTPISAYIPDTPVLENVTLQHLLNMTSGLPDHDALMQVAGGLPHHGRKVEDYLTLLRKAPSLLFAPGTGYHYADVNMLLVAEIITNIGLNDYHATLRDMILSPCNINEIIHQKHNDTIRPEIAQPYMATQAGWRTGGTPSILPAISDTALSLADCIAWINALRDGQIDGTSIAPLWDETKINDTTPVQYGMGMMVRRYRGLRLIGHAGYGNGYAAHIFYAPDLDMGFVVALNQDKDNIVDIFQLLIDIFTAEALPVPPIPEQAAQNMEKARITDASAQKLNGTYINSETGRILSLTWAAPFLCATMPGATQIERLTCNAHGYFSTFWGRPLHLKPVADASSSQIVLDAIINGQRQRFVRVDTLGAPKHNWMDYVGEYMLEQLDARLTLTARSGQVFLRTGGLVNAGWTTALKPLAQDIFQTADNGPDGVLSAVLQFDREPHSKVIRQVTVTSENLPLLTFRKLRSF